MDRRTFLAGSLSFSLGPMLLLSAPPPSWGMGEMRYVQGLREAVGDVRVNGRAVRKGDAVGPGDVVTTGADGRAVFVVGRSVYLLRAASRLELGAGDGAAVRVLRILNGRLLAVFAPGEKRIETATVAVGLRGTGVYVDAAARRTYLCLCYGEAQITPLADPGQAVRVKTRHHESPRYIAAAGGPLITPAPVADHTDEELIMLEALVWRSPPFVAGASASSDAPGGGY